MKITVNVRRPAYYWLKLFPDALKKKFKNKFESTAQEV